VDLVGKEAVDEFVKPKDLVRHIVVTVDNLSTEKVAERLRPVSPIPGKFVVSGSEEAPTLDPANYERYKSLVLLFRSTDTSRLDCHVRPLLPVVSASVRKPRASAGVLQ
jgi:hypothetical protein